MSTWRYPGQPDTYRQLDRPHVQNKEAKFLGKRVKITLDKGGYPDPTSPAVIIEGQFLGFGDDGEFEVLMEDGFVHYGWPLLDVELAE